MVKEQILILEAELSDCLGTNGGNKGEYWSNCRFCGKDGKRELLSEKLDQLIELFFAGKYNPSNETSYYIVVDNSARQAENYYRFAKEVTELWDDWVEMIRYLYKQKHNADNGREPIEPLIYFMFDDVDIAPGKVEELLSIIIKYLSHPNLIVITTADEEMFLEVIENNLDKNIGRIPREWRSYLKKEVLKSRGYAKGEGVGKGGIDLISQTARLYLGKVMPTSTRYYLQLFKRAEQKQQFRLNDSERLGTGIVELVGKLLTCQVKEQGQPRRNFMQPKEQVLDFYLNFFGDTSRQIGNAHLAVKEFLDNLKEGINEVKKEVLDEEGYLDHVFHSCVHFLNVSISANHDLAENIEDVEGFVEEIFWFEHNQWRLYIKYSYLYDFLDQLYMREKKSNLLQVIKMALQLYSLLLFAENVLLILETCTKYGITNRKKIHGISSLATFICTYAFDGRSILRQELDAEAFFSQYATFLNKLCSTIENGKKQNKFNMEYFYDLVDYVYVEKNTNIYWLLGCYKESKSWFREILSMVSLVYGNCYLIGREEIENCLVFRSEVNLCGYQRAIDDILIDNLFASLSEFNLERIACETLKQLKDQLEDGEKLKAEYTNYCYHLYEDLVLQIAGESVESLDGKTPTERMIPMTEIIYQIDEECRNCSIIEVLNRCPKLIAADIFQRLWDAWEEQESGFLALKILSDTIYKWDNKDHNISFDDMSEFISAVEYDLEGCHESKYERENLAEHLKAMLSTEELGKGKYLVFVETEIYQEIKRLIQNIDNDLKDETAIAEYEISDNEINYKYSILTKMQKNIDVAIDLNKTEDFESAVQLGLIVQLVKRFQTICLYQTVRCKYKQNNRFSSYELRQLRVRNNNGRVKKSSMTSSYYHKLFMAADEVISQDWDYDSLKVQVTGQYPKKSKAVKDLKLEELKNDVSVLRSFMKRANFIARHNYIGELLNEVRNEPV